MADSTINDAYKIFVKCQNILQERQKQHGSPDVIFRAIAKRWQCTPQEAALKLAELKLARMEGENGMDCCDNFYDAINYIALAWSLGRNFRE